ncbi:MAG TPA: hypothetical protein VKG79_02540 [Bryobacteraceae bacterium]|nr:hypothetical protein [Bryobacteraceae bacterium]
MSAARRASTAKRGAKKAAPRETAPKKTAIPEQLLAAYEQLVATIPGIECKGATHPYTSLNGNMFSCLHPPGVLALRLPGGEREKFLEKYKARLFESYGVVQKEYVTVPDGLLKNTEELRKYFQLSHDYVKSLKPKATKRP